MKVPSGARPELLVSDRDDKPHLHHPRLVQHAGRSHLVATTGTALVLVPVETHAGDVDGVVPCGAITAARAGKGKLLVNGRADCGDVSWKRPGPFTPIPFADVIPTFKLGDPDVVAWSLDPRLLLQLAKAMGSERLVKLLVRRAPDGYSLEAMLVLPEEGDVIGVIMPCNPEPRVKRKPRMRQRAEAAEVERSDGVVGE